VLEVTDLTAGYNGLAVVRGLSLTVAPGEVVALLGPNGAGKTTTLKAIAGLLKPLGGTITVDGAVSAGRPAHVLARRGVALVPEDRAIFADLTTRENLRVAATGKVKDREAEVLELLPELRKCLDRKAGLLSGGEQQMLTLARAVARAPKLLLVDELSLGLAPVVVKRLLQTVRRVASERSTGILLVEQHVRQALNIADRVYVMQRGRIVMSGTGAEVHGRIDEIEATYLSGARDEPTEGHSTR
jgi:branched-chain amino acid transport system ATP-binding protein